MSFQCYHDFFFYIFIGISYCSSNKCDNTNQISPFSNSIFYELLIGMGYLYNNHVKSKDTKYIFSFGVYRQHLENLAFAQ